MTPILEVTEILPERDAGRIRALIGRILLWFIWPAMGLSARSTQDIRDLARQIEEWKRALEANQSAPLRFDGADEVRARVDDLVRSSQTPGGSLRPGQQP